MNPDTDLFNKRILSGFPSCARNAVLLVAVSGGADSTALLLSVHANARHLGCTLRCIHVDHGLRPEVERIEDKKTIKRLCRKLDVPCAFIHIKPGRIAAISESGRMGTEAAARLLRHRALSREARRVGASWILLGHTAEDRYENILMALLRGSGPEGLAPLPYRRGHILRPLLYESRDSILAYLSALDAAFKTDSTNADTKFYRNRVRHSLVPVLNKEFPDWKKTILSFSRTQELVSAMIKEQADTSTDWMWNTHKGSSVLELHTDCFNAWNQLVREELLYRGINCFRVHSRNTGRKFPFSACSRGPRRLLVRSFASGTVRSVDMGDLRLQRCQDSIRIEPGPRIKGAQAFSVLVSEPGIYKIRFARIRVSRVMPAPVKNTSTNDFIQSSGPLVFRSPFSEDHLKYQGRLRPIKKVLEAIKGDGYTDIMVAEDAEGVAALVLSAVDSKILLCNREKDTDAGSDARDLFFSIKPRGDYA